MARGAARYHGNDGVLGEVYRGTSWLLQYSRGDFGSHADSLKTCRPMHLLLLALLSLAALFTGGAVQAQGQAEAERKVTVFVLEDWRITNWPMPQGFT